MQDAMNWLARDPDPRTREEFQHLIDEGMHDELEDRFTQRLEFGTAGLRGKVGCGPNRMNRLVIQETATGLGHYLIEHVANATIRGVVVGYDGRLDSKQFAIDTASVLTALGIKVYLTANVAATPIVAFGIEHFNAAAAVVVTASHNPPEYNGFKVYWENGAQIIPPHDAGIAAEIDIASTKPIPLMSLSDAETQGKLVWLTEGYYQTYRAAINQSPYVSNEIESANTTITYTAMHGVGAQMAEDLLHDSGFHKVFSVAEQREPDGNFPTVNFPNPEEKGAMDLVVKLAKSVDADIACANDPDADRFAVAVRTEDDSYKMLTGDQVGVLFAHYLLSKPHTKTQLVGNSIVSSTLLEKVAKSHGATYFQTLTGFKWLANIGMQLEDDQNEFLFAYEEALGYTIGTQVRDKDGLSAIVVFAQLVEELKSQGRTVWDLLAQISFEHGVHTNAQRSIALDPDSPSIGSRLRSAQPKAINGVAISVIEDLQSSLRFVIGGNTEAINLPASDVLIYHLEDGSRIIVRPSGTEPKVKVYYETVTKFEGTETYEDTRLRGEQYMDKLIEQHQQELNS
ncbi:phospho-sugar mutase [Vibrio sp. 10N.261.46.E12]|uniref:phospho-sugar mutase n=1 Tax=unclassified Vibrio TaxID=2614977 RepID=UPI000976D2CC|nr:MULTISPECIES: phospho-sugar mutase [unclassified Vibrio]OMO37009.1 phosphoglucomutase [Vibrio sp. 10N.261.45.E1]PMJ24106.1 phosphoglucomutase [Vibrio sp. 10N.286.45.B6]PML90084.1 phosphoglucomutase [Vibrio sp. 10N.261.49.E11]PMM75745.1 phosphoglucomutase [Vibrio sp. 10N.261.46.F12]PMM85131.1 phosphoglucomutase [Vibrio sp. 10N.261.46.E8]